MNANHEPPEVDDSDQWDQLKAVTRYIGVLLVVLTCSAITVRVAYWTGGI